MSMLLLQILVSHLYYLLLWDQSLTQAWTPDGYWRRWSSCLETERNPNQSAYREQKNKGAQHRWEQDTTAHGMTGQYMAGDRNGKERNIYLRKGYLLFWGVWWRLTTGTGGEVLEWGPLYAEVSVSYHKHLVQNSSVVDEALEHTGRMDISQTPRTEDQRHLQYTDIAQTWNKQREKQTNMCNFQAKALTSWESKPCAPRVLQTGVNEEK